MQILTIINNEKDSKYNKRNEQIAVYMKPKFDVYNLLLESMKLPNYPNYKYT